MVNEVEPWKAALSAFGAGCSSVLFYPLELLKVQRIVSDGHTKNLLPQYRNSFQALTTTFKTEGFTALYRGCHLQLIDGLIWGGFFYIYRNARTFHASLQEPHPQLFNFITAAEASFLLKFVVAPLHVVKVRIMLIKNSEGWLRDTIDSFAKVWKVDGIRGYWSGITPSLMLSINGALHLFFYENMKDYGQTQQNSWKTALAGSLSKSLASFLTYPLQTIKYRLQQEQHTETRLLKSRSISKPPASAKFFEGVRQCAISTYKVEGIRGFYRGLALNMCRVAPSNGLFFALYEYLSQL